MTGPDAAERLAPVDLTLPDLPVVPPRARIEPVRCLPVINARLAPNAPRAPRRCAASLPLVIFGESLSAQHARTLRACVDWQELRLGIPY